MSTRFPRTALAAAVMLAISPLVWSQTPTATTGASATASRIVMLNLPPQPLHAALESFAAQTGMQWAFSADDIGGAGQANAVNGAFTVEEGLSRLLAGTGMTHHFVNANTFRVVRIGNAPAPAAAAEASGAELADATQSVVIVGSNLGGRDKASPVTVITSDDIERSGYASIEDVFRRLPQSFSAMTSVGQAMGEREFGDKYGNPSTIGSSGINLRGLGSGATLVLINGRRKVGSSQAGGSFVDISSIPLSQIARIEVLTDGASAIYGSDAVAGVVNIVLKEAFDGPTVNLRTERSSTGGDTDRFSLANTFSWDGGHLSGNLSLSRSKPVDLWDRIPVGPTGTGDYTDLGGSNRRLRGIGTPGVVYQATAFVFPGFPPFYQHGPALGVVPGGQNGGNVTMMDLVPLDPNQPYSPSYFPHDRVGPQTQQQALNLSGEQSLGGGHMLHADLNYSLMRDKERWHPNVNDFSFLLVGNPMADPVYWNTRCLFNPATNPHNKMGMDVCVGYSFEKEAQLLTLTNDQRQTNVNASLGATGPLSGTWQYDVNVTQSRDRSQTDGLNALRMLSDPDPQSAALVLSAMNALNPFSDGNDAAVVAQNASILAGLMKSDRMRGRADELTLDALARGTLAQLPAGYMRAAVGMQLRRESQQRTIESVSVDINGKRNVAALFSEVGVPLLKDVTGAKDLSLTLAGRYERFALKGSGAVDNRAFIYAPDGTPMVDLLGMAGFDMARQLGTPWVGGLDGAGAQPAYTGDRTYSNFSPLMRLAWMPVDGWRLRTTLGRSFLTPDARQIMGLTSVSDESAALADLNVPADVTTLVTISGANPKLGPQTARTFTLGTDIMPPSVPGLKLGLTYNHTVFNNYITDLLEGGLTLQQLIDQRDQLAPGTIQINDGVLLIDERLQNANRRVSRSVDLDAAYSFETDIGAWSAGLHATRSLELSSRATAFTPAFQFGDSEYGPSKWKGTATLGWDMGEYGASMAVNYSSGHRVLNPWGAQLDPMTGETLVANPLYRSAGYTTVDAQVSWTPQVQDTWAKGLRLTVGAQNLFDAKFPFVDTYYGFLANRVNPRGRVLYLEFSKQF